LRAIVLLRPCSILATQNAIVSDDRGGTPDKPKWYNYSFDATGPDPQEMFVVVCPTKASIYG
jgi:hypothetical protein